jgi:hypothetical protein
VTSNIVSATFDFAVAVSNTTNNAADILIEKGNNIIVQQQVAANSVAVITLPWDNTLKGAQASNSMTVADGAFRLRSTVPVTVYQYNPLQYTKNGGNSYTNDASILLPVNVWGDDYWVASRNTWQYLGFTWYPGIYAVVASEDDTTVDLNPSATGGDVRAGGGVQANGTGQINLDQGDVIQVFSAGVGQNPSPSDLTGTQVTSDKPVQVIGGHQCTFVPHNIGYCDHMEESMLPFDNLAKKHIVTPPLIPTGGNQPKAQFVRIIATTDDTDLTYDPPNNQWPANIASAGDYVEIGPTAADFYVESDKKVVVSQYMQGQDAGGNSGDPAMTFTVPNEQYRDSYLFHAPTNYEYSYANITRPENVNVTLDGNAVNNGWVGIGNTGYEVVRVTLNNNGNGNHTITADEEVGISVYGYGQYTSYWYPGGLDLSIIPQ